MSPQPTDLLFITGATGFIGATTTLQALQAGYRVRLSVRKEAQIPKLKGVFAQYADQIEFIITPDITKEDAFAGALKDVTHIIHAASPLAVSPNPEDIIPPAVNGTTSILKEAAKVPSVKKLVITSSVSALMPVGGSGVVPEGVVVKEETDLDLSVAGDEKFDVPNPMLKSFRVYAASKLLANKATWDFLANEKPQFSLVTIHPTMVYGNSIIQDSSETGGTNAYIFGCIVNGVKGMDALLKAVHVRDVAQAHIRALDDDIKNKSYLLNGKRMDWKELREWSEKYYPEESKSFKLVSNDQPKVIQTDTSRAEKELGIEWIEPEEMIKEVLDQQISYLKKEGQL